ncbi:unnamed protein product [Phytophthora lilii]|uniref:Unnamed protein product n=1 Tax=Phytophthora lilii TaxID=2077276 RepID=A0A9W7D8Y8_9STRA|nr:unnamed protein product [Phytophthora lilii]
MFGEKKKQLQQAAKEAAAAAAAGANAEASANFNLGPGSTPNGAAVQSFQSMHGGMNGASLGLTNDPDHPQNAGLFGHHPMLSGGMPGDFHDGKNSVLGLNLVPSDFSHGGTGSVHPQQLQQQKDAYYGVSKQDESDKPSGERPGSPVGSGEPSGDNDASQSDVAVCKVEKTAEKEQEEPQKDEEMNNSDDAQAAKENETMTDKSTSESSALSPKREPKQINPEDSPASTNPAKSDDVLDASPTKAAPTSESRTPSTTSESQPSSTTDTEKRPHADVLGAASTSPHKRQRVAV